ncbi:MAG: CapA family protein [Phycisphaerae bacterium]|nr:CapA family protein [Phycisphaerae bacterium]
MGKLTFVGDCMPGRLVGRSLERMGLSASARRVRASARGAEDASSPRAVVVANLECALDAAGPARPYKDDGGPNLHASPAMADWLRQAGVDVLVLANNHAGDCGRAGIVSTCRAIRSAGLACVGAGDDYDRAIAPLVVRAGDARVAIVAVGNGLAADGGRPGVSPLRTATLRQALARVESDVDATVVVLHGGIEFLSTPESWLRDLAAEAVRGGADLVVGGHPHCLRGLASVGGRPVFYSLGDFLADTRHEATLADHVRRTALTALGFGVADPSVCRWSMALDVTVQSRRRLTWSVRPLVIDEDFLPRPATPQESTEFDRRMAALCEAASGQDRAALRFVRAVEKAYARRYGTGRTTRQWLTLPFRVRGRHLRSLWRRARELVGTTGCRL